MQAPPKQPEASKQQMTVGHILGVAFSALAVFGVVTSTVFSLLVAAGVQRFRSLPAAIPDPPYLPPVSVLKALHGDEPDLEANLTSIFEQDYPDFEILFCARHSTALALEPARRVATRYPQISSRILTCGEPPWPNAR